MINHLNHHFKLDDQVFKKRDDPASFKNHGPAFYQK